MKVQLNTTEINYSFQINQHGIDRIEVDLPKLRKFFKQVRPIEGNHNWNIPKYVYYSEFWGRIYRYYGNTITTTLINVPKQALDLRDTRYYQMVEAIDFLFTFGLLKYSTEPVVPLQHLSLGRKSAYKVINERGETTIRHAIDIPQITTSRQASSINTLGTRTQHQGFTRYEVNIKGHAHKDQPWDFIENDQEMLINKHVRNLYAKTSLPLLTRIIGVSLGKDKQHNYIKIRQWLTPLMLDKRPRTPIL